MNHPRDVPVAVSSAYPARRLLPWGPPWLDGALQDVRYATRLLRRSPGVTVVAVLSLALGIGANTAIFTLIESTLLRPIAVKDVGRLRLLMWREQDGGWTAPNLGYQSAAFGSIYEQGVTPDGGILHTDFSPRVYQAFLTRNGVFDELFAFKELGRVTAVIDGNAEAVNCFAVSGNFYRGTEVTPILGRAIGPEAGPIALLSYEYWTRRFARNPSVIGKTITVNDVPLTIVGVNPEYFTGIEPGANFEIWTPLDLSTPIIGRAFFDQPRAWQVPMMGRLKTGVSDARAFAEMNALFQAQVDADPGLLASMLQDPRKRPRFLLQPAARGVDYLNQRYERMLLALWGLAGLVLLIASANVANLLLSKAAVRRREIGLRLALGSGQWRIVRQLMAEGFLLASMAGFAGVLLGYWARNLVPALLTTPWRPSLFDTTFDPKTLFISIAVTFLTGILFSLAPVWQARRVEVNEALKDGGRRTGSLSKLRIGRSLVVVQVALSVLLLAGAGLCVKTFTSLRAMPLGFRPAGLVFLTLDPPRLRYQEGLLAPFLTELQSRFAAVPGVQSVTFSRNYGDTVVGAHFFETMGIPIRSGQPLIRDLRVEHSKLPQAVINEAYVRRFFRGRDDPLRKSITGSDGAMYQIVGVCADWHFQRLRDPVQPAFYSAFTSNLRQNEGAVHQPSNPINFEIRIAGNEAAIATEIRHVVHSVDSSLAVMDVRTAEQQIQVELSQERLLASLALIFGGLALLLATIGIYGVMAYAVVRRTGEIGIRVALGAEPEGVAWMIMRDTLLLAALGAALGIPAVLSLNPILDHFLAPGWEHKFAYGTRANDPLTIASAILALIVAGVLAGYLPARRAARVDPITALRHE